ncbi:MAG: hypothetical protein NWF07_00205 [Candidatus Bathyarchaeota archaeon]|nr:hypothetical protein [Candidatus Bathyarchaeota archaeon]
MADPTTMGKLLRKVKDVFGEDLDQGRIREALCFDENQGLASVGNDVLDLCNSLILYRTGHYSSQIDTSRQKRFTRDRHRSIVNSDPELVEYLIATDYEENNQQRIGVERSDRYLEAIIGALYLKDDMKMDDVVSFVKDLFY